MKKKLLIIGITLASLLSFTYVWATTGAFGLNTQYSNQDVSNGAVISTSTLNYLTAGTGTTTLTLSTRGTDQVDVNIFGVASGTPMDLRYTVEFSNSTSSVLSEQVFYPMPVTVLGATNATTTIQGPYEGSLMFASTTSHRIATSTAMTNTFDPNTTFSMSFRIKDIAANWTRLVFYIPTKGDTRNESTALGPIPAATSTNAGIIIQSTRKDPL